MISFDGAVKLLDFGIAKALAEANENRTVTGTLKGKFGYMSPEQVEGKEIDHRSDLFAAGVVLYEILTGKRLFKGGSDLQTIAMVRDAKVDRPSLINPAVPRELDDICLKALARVPDDRWRGCDEMAVALDEVVHALKWGPERLAAMQRELFPDEPSHSNVVHMGPLAPTAVAARNELTVGALKRHRWRRRVAWAGATLLVIGLVSVVVTRATHRSEPAAATAPAPTTPAPAPAPPAPAPPALPATVTVRVVTTPPGADVFLDGENEPRGKTPLALTMPRSSQNLRLAVKLRGYEPQTSDVTPDSDSRLQMTLSRMAPPRPVAVAKPKPAPKPSKPAPAPARPKQPVPDLHRGDVVDPFAR
jgi:hypothetical protein